MIRHRLSNVVLKIADHMVEHPEAYYRMQGVAHYDTDADALIFSGEADFLTYFNACSIQKWCRYAQVETVWLHLEFSGDPCSVCFVAASDEGEVRALGDGKRLNGSECATQASGGRLAVDLQLPACDQPIVSFVLASDGETALHCAYYFAEVDEAAINPVRLALATTTFKKEQYIVSNIDLVKREVLGSKDAIADAFHMFVVDNGRTLDAKALSDSGVTVLPNPNVGGAGGFARGMMEALAAKEQYTHVLLMDDDVIVSPESLKRTFNLLALAQGKYKNACINGAMLAAEEPNKQYEDVARVFDSGTYSRIKGNLYIDQVRDIAQNELIDVELPKTYGAWWFSCIPLNVVREKGLPLPLFVRCDDVEYGMRMNPTYMTMNGICVWHDGFEGRFKASVDCYQAVRNFLITIAMDDCASEQLFLSRFDYKVRLRLRAMDYDAAELFLDAFEDYLEGPDYLAQVNGEDLMKAHAAKNEKLVPLQELDQSIVAPLASDLQKVGKSQQIRKFMRLWRTLPYDRHYIPSVLLRNKPEAIFYSDIASAPASAIGTKTLVAVDPGAKNGHVRHMDKARWRTLKQRWAALKKEHSNRGAEVRAAYKAAKPHLTSWEFWNDYLGTDLEPEK